MSLVLADVVLPSSGVMVVHGAVYGLAMGSILSLRAAAILATPTALRESARQQADALKAHAVTARLQELPITASRTRGSGRAVDPAAQAGYRTVGAIPL